MSLWLTLLLVVSASTAMAAEIVEVRVGRHAEFTRVVFELDRAAGYRIERASPSAGVSELVVSLEATSIPRRVRSSKSLIEQVDVEPAGGRSVARVRLSKSGLKLKEMILANPPRIVLDVLSDEPVVKTAAKPTPAPAPKAATAQPEARPEPKPEPKQVTRAVEEPKVARTPRQAATTQTTTPATPAAEARRAATAEPEVAAVEETRVERRPRGAAVERRSNGSNGEEPLAQAAAETGDEAATGRLAAEESGDSTGGAMDLLRAREQELAAAGGEPSTSTPSERLAPKPAKAKKTPPKATPRPMVAKMPESEGGGWMTWALAGVGAIVLLVGGFLFVRSRQGGEEVDYSDGEGDQDDAPVVFGSEASSTDDVNPFAEMSGSGDQMTLGSPDATKGPGGEMDEDGETTLVSTPDDHEQDSGSLAFGTSEAEPEGDSEEKDMDTMDVISRDAVNESLGGMPPAMGGVPEEFQQMMREMNRRVEALEGRIDELVDARDRLERQVAAQTEELRVQRAAIARTQRAVRNLARPEDEQEATEPALRDPNKPSSEE
jgi:hypothetical protein